MMITKSDYLLYTQCKKSFWLHKNKPALLDDSTNQSLMDKGNEVTEAARELFPHGILVPYSSNAHEMVTRTKELIEQGVETIYEAAFQYDGCYVICDILQKKRDVWSVYEVKSSTGVKQRHLDDITFQFYVIANNLPTESISLVHIRNDYVRNGKLDVKQLFQIVDQTEHVVEHVLEIPLYVENMKELLEGKEPKQDIGEYCNKYKKDNFECGAKGYCWAHVPEYSVFNIARIGKKAFDLYDQGILHLEDIPESFKLSENQSWQVNAQKENTSIVEKEAIQEFLATFTSPLYFLDFETFQQAIPQFDQLKPYEQIPFQYSLHIVENDEETLLHKEFLGKEGEDPRRPLAEKLVQDIPQDVTTVAYNMSFEKMVLRQLANLFPDLEEHLLGIHDGMVDLMIPFHKKWYYTNAMQGSYSIKYVLPALLPNDPRLDYKQLAIQNGSMAMTIYEKLHTFPKEDIQQIRKNLLAYCHLDTLAMVRIWQVLKQL